MVSFAGVTVASCPWLPVVGRPLAGADASAEVCRCINASAVSAATLTAIGQGIMLPMSVGCCRCHTALRLRQPRLQCGGGALLLHRRLRPIRVSP